VDESQDAVIDLAKKYAALEHEAKGSWPGGKLPFKLNARIERVSDPR
jgi:hypothetical protein